MIICEAPLKCVLNNIKHTVYTVYKYIKVGQITQYNTEKVIATYPNYIT